MKKKFLLLPLLMLSLIACDPVSDLDDSSNSDPTVTDPITIDPTETGSDTGSDIGSDTNSEQGPVVKEEIDADALNYYFDFDIYSLLPKIYSNDYLISEDADENFPIDVYIDLFDWDDVDIESYDDALESLFAYDYYYGYVIRENLFIFVTEEDNPYINIYSDAFYEPTPESSLWPAEVINEFFGSSEIGSLVPAFVSSSSFSYFIAGEDDYVQLIIYTEYPTIAGESIYVNALLNAGWIVDDSYYDYMGYDCWDVEQQISLIFYWQDGVMYWDFMVF